MVVILVVSISMQKDMIDSIKPFFQEEIKVFWEKPEHIAVHQDDKALWPNLYHHCFMDSKRPGFCSQFVMRRPCSA